jgi:hypothetical protein
MKKLGKILLIALGFGLVVIALGFFTSPPAPAQNSVPDWDKQWRKFRRANGPVCLCKDTAIKAGLIW